MPEATQQNRPDGLDNPETRQEVTEEIKEIAEAALEGDPQAEEMLAGLADGAQGDPVRQEVLQEAEDEAVEEELDKVFGEVETESESIS